MLELNSCFCVFDLGDGMNLFIGLNLHLFMVPMR